MGVMEYGLSLIKYLRAITWSKIFLKSVLSRIEIGFEWFQI